MCMAESNSRHAVRPHAINKDCGSELHALLDEFLSRLFRRANDGLVGGNLRTMAVLLIYKEFAREIEHDLVVIAVFVENVRRVVARYRYFADENGREQLFAKPYFTLEPCGLKLCNVPPGRDPVDESDPLFDEFQHIAVLYRFPTLRGAFRRLRRSRVFERTVVQSGLWDRFLGLLKYQPITEYQDRNSPPCRLLSAILAEWISCHDRPVMVVPLPLYHYLLGGADASHYQSLLAEATLAAGGTFYDPLPELVGYPKRQRRQFYFSKDVHMTQAGNLALAECLAPPIIEALSSH